jgi:hypothetical protein
MRKNGTKSQAAENRLNLVVDNCITNAYSQQQMKRNNKAEKMPVVVTFRPDPDDYKIILAAKRKHGLKKTTDLLRMALRRLKEAEGLEVA